MQSNDYKLCVTREECPAIYHCHIQIISRGQGRSAVAAAAYRSGTLLTNQWDGQAHDYRNKHGIVHTETLLPEPAPRIFSDRAILWSSVEEIEKSSRVQLAREVEIALTVELNREAQIELARAYVQKNFVDAGMCADLAIHDKDDGNPHAHILLTMRPILPSGEWGAKSKLEYILDENNQKIRLPSGKYKSRKISTVDWNEQSKAEEWREAWADACNLALERIGSTGGKKSWPPCCTMRSCSRKTSRFMMPIVSKGRRVNAKKIYEAHRSELAVYQMARRELKKRANGVGGVDVAGWQTELTALKAEREKDYAQLQSVRKEVRYLQGISKACMAEKDVGVQKELGR